MLDGLRGLAALVVVISHSANAGYLPIFFGNGFGQSGVALFYVLSAFLLTRLYIDKDFSKKGIFDYCVKRLARVLPLFYCVVIVSGILLFVFGITQYSITSSIWLLLNLLILQGTSVLWSVPVEIHFYGFFIFLWWMYQGFRKSIVLVCVLTLLTQMGLLSILSYTGLETGMLNIAFWLHIFLIGVVLAKIEFVPLSTGNSYLHAIAAAFLFFIMLPEFRTIIGIPVLPTPFDPFSIGIPVLLFYFALRQAPILNFLEASVFQWLGRISFSLYLLHWPIIEFFKLLEITHEYPFLSFLLILILSMTAAWTSFLVVERTSQDKIRKWLLK